MERVHPIGRHLTWLGYPEHLSGYDPRGWRDSTWILHAMHLHPDADLASPRFQFARPNEPWGRIRWSAFLESYPDFVPDRTKGPWFDWFPDGSLHKAVLAPPEGTMDQESFEALIRILDAHKPQQGDTDVFAVYDLLANGELSAPHVWRGPITDLPGLIEINGGRYQGTPSNIWPADRSWFVETDWDLCGTKISGTQALIDEFRQDAALESAPVFDRN